VQAKAATSTIPIVFVSGSDLVRTGLVASLNRPGGNVTGVTFTTIDLAAKQLGLLHELVPDASVIAVLRDPNQPELEAELRALEEAGRAIGRRILVVKAANEREFGAAFAAMSQAGAGGLLVRGGAFFLNPNVKVEQMDAEAGAKKLGLQTVTLNARNAGEFDAAFEELLSTKAHAFITATDPILLVARFNQFERI
jgi:ABC transporter substrate binding protein